MNKYIIKNGEIFSSGPRLNLPDLIFIGIEWVIVEAISEKEALYQASLFKQSNHHRQKEMVNVFEKVRFLEYKHEAKKIIMKELYPPPPNIESVVLCIEAIGYTSYSAKYNLSKKRYWVAEIIELDEKWKFKRKFIDGKKDFSNANKRASRGVYLFYTLSPYKIYDVSSPISNSYTDRYYCRIENNQEIRMSEQEVKEWLKEDWV